MVVSDGRVAVGPLPGPALTPYAAAGDRYEQFPYQRCGRSGLLLPPISLGLWQGFGHERPLECSRAIVRRAFDCGVTHFDLANNYGLPMGSAEETFGHLLATDLRPYRDELIVSTKAGWGMWPGPYGDFGSRKYLLASLDASLRRLGLEYVDVYYSHRLDPETPLEETMGALDAAVRQGKALYVGISSYPAAETREAARILRGLGTPAVVHQPSYSLLNRRIEPELLDVLREEGLGCAVFSPLAQGLLAGRYLDGMPAGSRASQPESSLGPAKVEMTRPKVRALDPIARRRGQTLAQMALAWVLRDPVITSALVGVSSVEQLDENLAALDSRTFTAEELTEIDQALA
jgi:L-glyceraldehyde 3-phosphate reductase